jgi:hypothetical protein
MQGGAVVRHRFSEEVGHIRGGRVQWAFGGWKRVWTQDGLRLDSLEVSFDLWMMANRAKFENHGVSRTRLSGRFGCAARIGHCGLPEGGRGLMRTVSAKVTSCTLCMAPRLSLSQIDRRCDL